MCLKMVPIGFKSTKCVHSLWTDCVAKNRSYTARTVYMKRAVCELIKLKGTKARHRDCTPPRSGGQPCPDKSKLVSIHI